MTSLTTELAGKIPDFVKGQLERSQPTQTDSNFWWYLHLKYFIIKMRAQHITFSKAIKAISNKILK